MRSDRYTSEQWATVDAFHSLVYGHCPHWLGVPILKNPMDLLIYQEILVNTRPELIIESGTAWGGSTLFLASICDLLGCGEVVSLDVVSDAGLPEMFAYTFGPGTEAPFTARPTHPRVTYLLGDVLSPKMVADVRLRAKGKRTMLILDSTHTREHVLAECRAYAPLVSPGCYLSIEDINVQGHPDPHKNPGPLEATYRFLQESPEFKWNLGWTDRYLVTQNAYLIRQEEPIRANKGQQKRLARAQS